MKRIGVIFLSVMMLFTGCAQNNVDRDFTVFHATDMHYISQQLTDNSSRFVQMIYEGDGKMVHYIDQMCDAFVQQVIDRHPDAVLIGGDITLNGEKLSHEDFAKKLKLIEDSGVQVLVIPGNHDIDYPFCFGYSGDYYYSAERLQKRDFEELYSDFGLSQAYSRDENTFSYFYKIKDNLVVLALDTNSGAKSVVSDETYKWMEKELKKIKKGTVVIALTHQNLLEHFPQEMFSVQYSIYNNQKIIDLFKKYNVQLNLSGHIHTQHIVNDETVTDIATESMALTGGQYGVVKKEGNILTYQKALIDVQAWAADTDQTDTNLLNYKQYSYDFFKNSAYEKALSSLATENITQDNRERIACLFADFNTYFFAGNLDEGYERLTNSLGYQALMTVGQKNFYYNYIMSALNSNDGVNNSTYWTIELNT